MADLCAQTLIIKWAYPCWRRQAIWLIISRLCMPKTAQLLPDESSGGRYELGKGAKPDIYIRGVYRHVLWQLQQALPDPRSCMSDPSSCMPDPSRDVHVLDLNEGRRLVAGAPAGGL